MKKSLFKTSGNSWAKGGGGHQRPPWNGKSWGVGGCKSKCLPWEGYGYFLELHNNKHHFLYFFNIQVLYWTESGKENEFYTFGLKNYQLSKLVLSRHFQF